MYAQALIPLDGSAVAECALKHLATMVKEGSVGEATLFTGVRIEIPWVRVDDEFQHINVKEVFSEAAKKVVLIAENTDIEETIKDAYFFAKTGKPGPVVIDFPMDLQLKKGTYKGTAIEVYEHKYDQENHLGRKQCSEFFHLLQHSKRPLRIYMVWW